MKYQFNQLKQEYADLWKEAKVTKPQAAKSQADLLTKHMDVYNDIGKEVGIPGYAIGVLHLREAGPADVGKWQCVLHNGQKIIGTGRKTTIEPKGRGPFTTFKEAAIDALTFQGLANRTEWKTNPIEFLAYVSEQFNGFGYRNKGIRSPYLWGGTTVQQKGKFVADHKFDSNVMDSQIGTMAVAKYLDTSTATVKAEHSAAGGAVASGIAAASYWPQYAAWILGGTVVGAFFVYFGIRLYKAYKGQK